jgi:hypothetical protein
LALALPPAAPPDIEAAAYPPKRMKIDRQHHDAQWKHPKAQYRQEPQHPAEQKTAAEQNAQKLRPRKSDRVATEPDPVAFRSRLCHRDKNRLESIEIDIAMPKRTR